MWNMIMARPQAKYPNENFVRFVARNYYKFTDRSKIHFLDIGCGAGANTWYLAHEGFRVTAIDASTLALDSLKRRFAEEEFAPNVHFVRSDITKWRFPDSTFNCALDNNSLCHIEEPPIEEIRDSLITNGKFFSVAPADDTWRGTLSGKGYCRCASRKEIEKLYSVFGEVNIAKAAYPDGHHSITSWIAECIK